MRRAMIGASVAVLCIGAAPPPVPLSPSSYAHNAQARRNVDAAGAQFCRDRIDHARAEAGKPKLERAPAGPVEPLLMYAVDTRLDGCGVLIPVADPADIRQIPEPGRPRLFPAR